MLEEEFGENIKEAEGEKSIIQSIIENLVDGLLVFDEKNHLYLINPRAEELLKVKSQKVLNRHILELSRFDNFQPLISLLGGGIKNVVRQELIMGERLMFEISSIPLMNKGGKIGTLVILRDITREKIIERTKTEFVSLTAHQLRTPISAIKWILKMFSDGDLGEITQKQKDFIDKAYKSNERMILLINDLLNVTRIEEGRYVFKKTLADIEEILQSIIDSYKEKIENKKLNFKLNKPWRKLPRIMLDVEKMKIASQSVIDNAVKYTKPGGTVTVSISCDNKNIEVRIKDTGVGIPSHQQYQVFNKFFRGTNVIKMETDGTGLGLFLAKNIIEAHGGRIWFESEENIGSTFSFTIPVKEEFGEFLTPKFY